MFQEDASSSSLFVYRILWNSLSLVGNTPSLFRLRLSIGRTKMFVGARFSLHRDFAFKWKTSFQMDAFPSDRTRTPLILEPKDFN